MRLIAAAVLLGMAGAPPLLAAPTEDPLAALRAALPGRLINDPASLDWATLWQGCRGQAGTGRRCAGRRGARVHRIEARSQHLCGRHVTAADGGRETRSATGRGLLGANGFIRCAPDRAGQRQCEVSVERGPVRRGSAIAFRRSARTGSFTKLQPPPTGRSTRALGTVVFHLGAARQTIQFGQDDRRRRRIVDPDEGGRRPRPPANAGDAAFARRERRDPERPGFTRLERLWPGRHSPHRASAGHARRRSPSNRRARHTARLL